VTRFLLETVVKGKLSSCRSGLKLDRIEYLRSEMSMNWGLLRIGLGFCGIVCPGPGCLG